MVNPPRERPRARGIATVSKHGCDIPGSHVVSQLTDNVLQILVSTATMRMAPQAHVFAASMHPHTTCGRDSVLTPSMSDKS